MLLEENDRSLTFLWLCCNPDYTWNRPATMTFPGGTRCNYGYDALMRLESLTATAPVLDYAYTYDARCNIVTKSTEHGNYTFEYDNLSRLTTADNPALDDESYTYDAVGNRLTAADVSGSWSYNQNNELLGYADVTYDYDDNGNLTQISIAGAPVWTYEYDAANRLVHTEDVTETITADYYCDPFGRRLWKDVDGTKTYFFYSEEGLIAEYDASGNEIRSYGYKPDSTWTTDPLWLKEGGAYYWYQNDHLGTPQKLVAQNGTVVWSAQYLALGEAQIEVETVTNNLRFPGQYQDDETGLYYNRFRYYDPISGRYVSVDPIGFIGGDMNLYRYARNNPANRLDPYGLMEIDDITQRVNIRGKETEKVCYSCKCGWIDRIHVDDGRKLWSPIWRGITRYEQLGNNIIDGLVLNQPNIPKTDIPLTSITGRVELMPSVLGKTPEQKVQLALDIFFEFEVAFEEHQSQWWAGEPLKHSGFSVEDLPSAFLGFMEEAAKAVPEASIFPPEQSTWEEFCEPLDKEQSLRLYNFGIVFEQLGKKLPHKNESHTPQLWVKGEFRQFLLDAGWCPCGEEDPQIPAVFEEWVPNDTNPDYEFFIEEHVMGW